LRLIGCKFRYHHAAFAKGPDNSRGANPELRLLFFRVASLSKLPLLPLFVFDGLERPKVKRGSKLGKAGSHGLTDGFKKLLDVFGMEWRMVRTHWQLHFIYVILIVPPDRH
jgi:Holliday junction resolvase YEN1